MHTYNPPRAWRTPPFPTQVQRPCVGFAARANGARVRTPRERMFLCGFFISVFIRPALNSLATNVHRMCFNGSRGTQKKCSQVVRCGNVRLCCALYTRHRDIAKRKVERDAPQLKSCAEERTRTSTPRRHVVLNHACLPFHHLGKIHGTGTT